MMKRMLILMLLSTLSAAAVAQTHSVLSAGRWWDITIQSEGMYVLTVNDLPQLKGVSVDSIGLYGSGAGMLSNSNAAVAIGDIQPVPIEVQDADGDGLFGSADRILFFGEGAEGWRYVVADARWEFEHHPYATANHYYLTTSAPAAHRVQSRQVAAAVDTSTVYTSVAHVDNDLVNIFISGQRWMGERFTTVVNSRTFPLAVDGNAAGHVKLRYAMAHVASMSGQFDVATAGYHNVVGITTSEVYRTVLDGFESNASSFDFVLTYQPNENSAAGYLDFIELNTSDAIHFGGGQKLMRMDPVDAATRRYQATGSTSGVSLWDVSSAATISSLPFDGGWIDSASKAKKYILFDGTQLMHPQSVAEMATQDLHGCAQATLVVVCPEPFLAQAQRVASLHEIFDQMTTLVATDRQVYAEFSSGKQDPMAIRSLLRSLKSRFPDAPPRYLLLFGKGTYDNRHLLGGEDITLVTYETPYSFDDVGASFCSDDFLGYLSPTGYGTLSEAVEVSVGRLPARTVAEANHLVDKIEGYITLRDLADEAARGDWRNAVALLADDADPGHPHDSAFAHSSEVVARAIVDAYPYINVEKLYADSYQQSSGAIGSYYPDLNNALRQRMNDGCLLINYIGHGSTTYIGTERYMELSDIDGFSNVDRMPLFVTSTCSFGRYDQPTELCGAEAAVLAPAAAVAVISAARPISHNEAFNTDVVRFALDPDNTIGDALRLAKNRTVVSQCISLIGDPALRLSQPKNRVVVTAINSRPVADGVDDTATVLSRVVIEGEVRDEEGVLIDDFDGVVYPVVYDRVINTHTLANDNAGTEVAFTQQKNVLYRGSHAVQGGRFQYSFVVPRDVAYQYDYAKLSHYARSVSDHATGSYGHLLLGGMNDTAAISTTPPQIRLYMGDTLFRSGGITDENPVLLAFLTDDAGINAGAGLGHDITAVLDGNPGSLVVLNDLYQPDMASTGKGSVSYAFTGLTPGRHTLTLKAWNIYNVSAEATISFTVCDADSLTLSPLICAPNPVSDVATFSLEVNHPSDISVATLQIFDAYGHLLYEVQLPVAEGGYVVGPARWDCSSVKPGLYMARLTVQTHSGEVFSQSTKCIVH